MIQPRKSEFSVLHFVFALAVLCALAAVARGQFELYRSRLRQNEARSNLSRIYTLEKTFESATHHYSICIKELGFAPDPAQPNYYTTGFTLNTSHYRGDYNVSRYALDGSVLERCLLAEGLHPGDQTSIQSIARDSVKENVMVWGSSGGSPGDQQLVDAFDKSQLPSLDNVSNPITFRVAAAGIINPASANLDFWTINQNKELYTRPGGI